MSHAETMLHLITYDITSDRLRTKVHNLLESYGTWTQFSLFECYLSHKQSVTLLGEIKALLNDDEAHIRIYMLSRDDAKRTVTIGGELPHEDEVFIA